MARNPHLDEAVALFTELGWADATYTDAPTLPLGTPAQKRAALAGLRTGEWGEDRWDRRRTWTPYVQVDLVMLWLFAIRLGVGATRAATVRLPGALPGRYPTGTLHDRDEAAAFEDALVAVTLERGPAFARTFVRHACGRCPDAAVRLVARHRLPVPDSRDYLVAWQATVLACLGEPVWRTSATVRPEVRDRFVDHVRAAFDGGRGADILPAVLAGVEHRWVDRDTVVDLVLAAMDAASGAGRTDRNHPAQVWLDVWLDDLRATDAEIVARGDALVPVLPGGGPYMIERLAPVLIAGVDDDLLADVAMVALTAPTKKALRPVLTALAARPRPGDTTRQVVGQQVVALDTGRDGSLARAVRTVVDSWGLEPVAAAAPGPQGLWQPTPPVWQVPRFDRGEATPETLTRLASELVRRRSVVCDVVAEQYLAEANAVARRDLAQARAALSGVSGLVERAWVTGRGLDEILAEATEHAGRIIDAWRRRPLDARRLAVFSRLGEVPCLLSEPSTVDLRIEPADLLARLLEYRQAGASASAADLFLALTRLRTDVDSALRAGFDRLEVPVLLETGRPMPVAAGPAVSRYLADPVVEPDTAGRVGSRSDRPDDAARRWVPPASLDDFSQELSPTERRVEVLPGWDDTREADWDTTPRPGSASRWNLSSRGVLLRQLARRGVPFTSPTVLCFLAAQDDPDPAVVSEAALALDEAWQRGLVRPGVADVQADWDGSSTLPAMARALAAAARRGLLSVVWPVMDDLLRVTSGPRLAAGTADIVGTVADLLPEVRHAVATGLAEPAALDLSGVRAVAARTGSSRAVTVAREIVAELPVHRGVLRGE